MAREVSSPQGLPPDQPTVGVVSVAADASRLLAPRSDRPVAGRWWRALPAGLIASLLAGTLAGTASSGEPAASGRVRRAAALDTLEGLAIEGDGRIVAEGPGGTKALRTDGKVEGAIDLRALAIDPQAYDLLEVEVKADPQAWLILSLENYPRPGWTSRWYPLDAVRGGFDWRTIWLDLKRPEEMFQAGNKGGTERDDLDSGRLRFSARVQPAKRVIQDPGRAVLLRDIRFVKEAVHLDWDQTQVASSWEQGKDLVASYPLTLANRTDRPVKARVALLPFKVKDATAAVTPETVEIAAGKTATVTATVTLPAAIAAKSPPLTSEFFEARASVEGLEDSEVTILRSGDPIHLCVTVPIPDEALKLPMLPRRKDLPPSILGLNDATRRAAEELAATVTPDHLDAWLGEIGADRFQQPWRPGKVDDEGKNLRQFMLGLSACAWLYDLTGERDYLDKGTALLLRAADRFSHLRRQWAATDVALISDGIIDTYCLALGWNVGGHWDPYNFPSPAYGHGDGVVQNFDLLAADMDPAARETIVRDFLVPAALQLRNHYVGLTNIQNVQNHAVLYVGLLTRNWPLVAHAYASEHGIVNLLERQFDEDGLANEGHYQTACIRPILWTTELLWHAAAVDLYQRRLHTILHSKSAEAIGQGYSGRAMRDYVDQHRFAGKPFLAELAAEPQTDGYHLIGGVTMLRWQGLSLAMNWGTHIFRNARDRCSVRFEVAKKHPLAALNGIGGAYTPSCYDQGVIVIDECLQVPVEAEVTGVDITGPVQFVQARSDEHFPGTTIVRTFAIVGEDVLVVDRVTAAAGRPHTVDWISRNHAVSLSVPVEERQAPWTSKPDDPVKGYRFGAAVPWHRYARTDGTFTNAASLMTMLGEPGTELFTYPVHPKMMALMVRRRNVTTTDFVAMYSARSPAIERLPVKTAAGQDAQAVGLKIVPKDAKPLTVIVNYEPEGTEVMLGELRTKDRLATDFLE